MAEKDEIVTKTAGAESGLDTLIADLKTLQTFNAALQSKYAVGSKAWHWFETQDDRIHEALAALGD